VSASSAGPAAAAPTHVDGFRCVRKEIDDLVAERDCGVGVTAPVCDARRCVRRGAWADLMQVSCMIVGHLRPSWGHTSPRPNTSDPGIGSTALSGSIGEMTETGGNLRLPGDRLGLRVAPNRPDGSVHVRRRTANPQAAAAKSATIFFTAQYSAATVSLSRVPLASIRTQSTGHLPGHVLRESTVPIRCG
jgi:hypothetical protein